MGLIGEMLELGPLFHRAVRRIPIPRFPYALYYEIGDETIEVRACLHQRRQVSRDKNVKP
jgi:plasmid stabilization system protein ParE